MFWWTFAGLCLELHVVLINLPKKKNKFETKVVIVMKVLVDAGLISFLIS